MSAPLLCFGEVMHCRLRPLLHRFSYRVFYLQLPLRRLDALQGALFGVDRWRPLALYSRDHGPRDGSALLPWIEAILRRHGLPADGEILLQTFPRVLGLVFNPVSFWFCHDRSGALIAVLAEVNNTFGGTHSYLLHRHGRALADGERLHADKVFHVSPFNRVCGHYRFRFERSAGRQLACIDYADDEGDLLLTSISGQPQPWSTASLLRALLRMPLHSLGILLRIHWQALRLWLKGVPFLGARPPASSTPEDPT